MNDYLKIPTEMAEFALRERKVRQVQIYVSGLFQYPGKAKTIGRPSKELSSKLKISEATVYRSIKWLLNRNWMGKDKTKNWFFFRGLDRVHHIEQWEYGRAAIIKRKDLKTFKAFMTGAVFASLVKSGNGKRSERNPRGSEPSAYPISLFAISKLLDVSLKTAQRLRDLATKYNYISNEQHLIKITNLKPEDLKHLKLADLDRFPVELLGYSDRKIVPLDRVRYKDNSLYLQAPNLITPYVQLKIRKGLIDTSIYRGTNDSQK